MALLEAPEQSIRLFKDVANSFCCSDGALLNIAVKNIEYYVKKQREREWHFVQTDPEPQPKEEGKYEVLLRYEDGEEWVATATWSNKVLITGNKKGFGYRTDFYNVDFEKNEVIAWREI